MSRLQKTERKSVKVMVIHWNALFTMSIFEEHSYAQEKESLLAFLRALSVSVQTVASEGRYAPGGCTIFEDAHNTPPQVDKYTYTNKVTTIARRSESLHLLLFSFRSIPIFLSTLAQIVLKDDRSDDKDRSEPGKKKPEKGKSPSAGQGNREQQEQQKPKTKGQFLLFCKKKGGSIGFQNYLAMVLLVAVLLVYRPFAEVW